MQTSATFESNWNQAQQDARLAKNISELQAAYRTHLCDNNSKL